MIGDFIKGLKFAFILLALLSLAWSAKVVITVEDKDGTKLEETNVQILQGQQLIDQKKANVIGNVSFELAPGFYFIHPVRGFYPEHIIPMRLVNDSYFEMKVVMLMTKPTYTLYGQVIDTPEDKWSGQKLYLIDENGAKMGETTIFEKGYYSLQILYPGKKYQIRVGSRDERKISSLFSYPENGIYYLQIDMRKEGVLVNASIKISSPAKTNANSLINVYLREGDKPVVGKTISATTPAGKMEIITNENGLAQIYAAGEGEYLFEYNGQSAKTVVEVVKKPEIPKPAPAQNENKAQIVKQTAVPEKPIDGNALFLGVGAGTIVVAAIVFGIIIVGFVAYFLTRAKEEKEFEDAMEKVAKISHHRKKHAKKKK